MIQASNNKDEVIREEIDFYFKKLVLRYLKILPIYFSPILNIFIEK